MRSTNSEKNKNFDETTEIEGNFKRMSIWHCISNYLIIINSTSTGFFLCKLCGADNSVLNLIINDKISEQAHSVQNVTVGSKNILVQELVNPLGVRFKVFLTKKANCAKTTGWYTGEFDIDFKRHEEKIQLIKTSMIVNYLLSYFFIKYFP